MRQQEEIRPGPPSRAEGKGAARIKNLRRQARRRPQLVLLALTLVLLLLVLARVLLGNYTVTLPDFMSILGGETLEHARPARFIVLSDKLPRAILGVLAGLAFGMGGAIFQLLLRNPLASPDIIGISSGASLGAVVAIAFWGASGFPVSLATILAALAVALLIMMLSAGADGLGQRFILMGIALAALAGAAVNYLLAHMSSNSAQSAVMWMTGSLAGAHWKGIGLLALALGLILPWVLLLHQQLHALAVGEELAHGLGLPVGLIRWTFIVLGVLLTALATAATGPVAFLAFVSGPIARRLLGGSHSLLAAGLVGASILVGADFFAANYIPAGPLPVGVVTGALGAPILIWLLVQAQKEGR